MNLPRRSAWTPRRRRGAALQLILGGALLMVVPVFLGDSAIAAGFRALAPVAWLMTVAGAVLLLFQREVRSRVPARASASGLVPLHPAPVKPAAPARRLLVRPDQDPLDSHVDTEPPPTATRRG